MTPSGRASEHDDVSTAVPDRPRDRPSAEWVVDRATVDHRIESDGDWNEPAPVSRSTHRVAPHHHTHAMLPSRPRSIADLRIGAASGGLVAAALAVVAVITDRSAFLFVSLESETVAVALHLIVGALLGIVVARGALPRAHEAASLASAATVVGVLWWVLGRLVISPLLAVERPRWTIDHIEPELGSLVVSTLAGAVVGAMIAIGRAGAPAPDRRSTPDKTRIVVVGGGFGGVAAAQHLERIYAARPEIEITLVSRSNSLLFTPMLAEVAGSSLEGRHISSPLRAICRRTRVREAIVDHVDLNRQQLTMRERGVSGATALGYDQLVLALGSVPDYRSIPGLAEHATTLKTLADAERLRSQLIGNLEQADVEHDPATRRALLTTVVAGGGFAGTETVAELFDLAHNTVRYYRSIHPSELRFVLVHSQDRILPELSADLAEFSRSRLEARGIEVRLGVRVSGADGQRVHLDDGSSIRARTVVWTAGNQPHPVIQDLRCEHDRRGAVLTDETMRVVGQQNVWAIGDCARIPVVGDPDSTHPPTAQHALRQGKAVARNIARHLDGRPPEPFDFTTIGVLVALGHRTAAAEIAGRRFSGFPAWFLWRTVYLAKLPGLERKVRVAIDWTIDLFFPRDIVLGDDDWHAPDVDATDRREVVS